MENSNLFFHSTKSDSDEEIVDLTKTESTSTTNNK